MDEKCRKNIYLTDKKPEGVLVGGLLYLIRYILIIRKNSVALLFGIPFAKFSRPTFQTPRLPTVHICTGTPFFEKNGTLGFFKL